jgi:signal transduction histidine kinase
MNEIMTYREILLPLFIEHVPVMIEKHIQDMRGKADNFERYIGNADMYAASLQPVYIEIAKILFEDDGQYHKSLKEIEKTGYRVGLHFGETKAVSREMILQIMHSIRVHSFEHVCQLINYHVSDEDARSLLISRLMEVLNVRFNGFIHGFLFSKDKMISHLHNQKVSIMGQMAAGMAHEIRNPLCALKGFQQLMKQMVTQNQVNQEEFLLYIDICIDEINKVEMLVSDFLWLARKSSRNEKQWKKIHLNEVLQKVYEICACFVLENSIHLQLDMPKDAVFIWGVASYIEQIILNIVKNSVSAMEDGGVLQVMLTCVPDQNEGILQFIDNGVGIPEEEIGKVFDPFFTTKEEGAGLGLAICKQLVEEMHGTITIQSKKGEGTKVEIRFPLVHGSD